VYLGKPEPFEESDGERLLHLAQRASLVIFETSAVFPFEFFPDKLIICANRITIYHNTAFSREEYPIPIESVTGASIFKSNPFFASLSIETFGLTKPAPIHYLRTKEARLARRYILALIECKKANIDLSGQKVSKLQEALKKIGMVRDGSGPQHHRL
jgi:hypothetical protein